MQSLPERIAQSALDQFHKLPLKCKPRTFPDGRREWTPLAAVVVVSGETVECLSIGTGTKCLPANALPNCNGSVLHDYHAEILALRGFNRCMLNELVTLLEDASYESPYIESRGRHTEDERPDLSNSNRPFSFKPEVSFHFFTTAAPCGDASMELLIGSKPAEDSLPWKLASLEEGVESAPPLLGRGYFSQLGVVRRKPARADSQTTMSKSCTDKVSLKQVTGILAFPADVFIGHSSACFMKSMTVFDDQYNSTAYNRSFSPAGRLSDIAGQSCFLEVSVLSPLFPPFEFAKLNGGLPCKASNISALWIRGIPDISLDMCEVLLNGVLQGYKQLDDRIGKASAICRRNMWQQGLKVASLIAENDLEMSQPFSKVLKDWSRGSNYKDAKATVLRETRRVKKTSAVHILRTWMPNNGDDDWVLDP